MVGMYMCSVFNHLSARVFNDFIENLDLSDIPLSGPRFTWSDKWGSKFSKLDRFLVTDGFMTAFPHLAGIVLEKNIPDHVPIILLEHMVDYGPIPFREFHSWFDRDGFENIVRDSWMSDLSGTGLDNPWVRFKKKLQRLKSNLRVWNLNYWNLLVTKKKNLQDLIESIDSRLMDGEGSSILREHRVSLLKEVS
ncbi:uncharacterized protein LOC111910809 [Lactuca sativa]|uniref:uncharacterized protein LOC111910809 n=1 Tax=Lactuca sativa TaxID=4236 RepID=UPI000CD95592|nr:uncharacterized protein LOC111910809 [Lactuca sativa]